MQGALKSLISLSLFAGAALYVCPEGGPRRMLRLLSAAMLTAAILAPLRELDYDLLSLEEARFQGAEAEITHRAARAQDGMKKLLMEENCVSYIKSRGQELGLRIESAELELRQDAEGDWLPYALTLRASGPETGAESLRRQIALELQIPTERQVWFLNE